MKAGAWRVACAAVLGIAASVPAHATTSDVSASGFLVTIRRETAVSAPRVYESLTHVERWWNDRHTWSGSAKNLSLQADASGCFCERWQGNAVEHGRVVYVARDSTLRLSAALGPLQALPVQGVLTFAMVERDGKTIVQVTYRVGGAATKLQALAPAVDGVITEQVDRLMRFVETGSAEAAR